MTALVTVFVPPRFHGTTFESVEIINSNRIPKSYGQRVHNGHVVIDIPVGMLLSQFRGPHGLEWERANPEAMTWLGESDRRETFGNHFPGEHRPPPVKHEAPPVVMVKLVAPANMSDCCIEGEALTIAANGTVIVTDKIADLLRSHGFRDAA